LQGICERHQHSSSKEPKKVLSILRLRKSSHCLDMIAEWPTAALTALRGISWPPTTSTRSLWCLKKSTPRMEKLTSTCKKGHWYSLPPNSSRRRRVPQQRINCPFAALSRGLLGWHLVQNGKILYEEPVSTSSFLPETVFGMKNRRPGSAVESLGSTVAIVPRLSSFPPAMAKRRAARSGGPCCQSEYGASRVATASPQPATSCAGGAGASFS
jgi:hypothetical protein